MYFGRGMANHDNFELNDLNMLWSHDMLQSILIPNLRFINLKKLQKENSEILQSNGLGGNEPKGTLGDRQNPPLCDNSSEFLLPTFWFGTPTGQNL